MSRARTVLPTDLVALVSFDGQVYANEAKPWDHLGCGGPHPLETALEQWFSFATGQHTWVSVRGATIRGLISARRRAKPSVWEVEVLINADKDESVALSLLERMVSGVAKSGAERAFLRLRADSPLLGAARGAGFFAYCWERLYRGESLTVEEPPGLSLRPQTREDMVGLFQLYNRVVPANVRAVEGLTLRQWQAAQEPWDGRPVGLVLEEGDSIVAWLRLLSGQTGRFSLLASPESPHLEALAKAAVARLAGSRALLCLVPTYSPVLAKVLEALGFTAEGEYVTLAKRLLKPSEQVAAEKVSTAVPIS